MLRSASAPGRALGDRRLVEHAEPHALDSTTRVELLARLHLDPAALADAERAAAAQQLEQLGADQLAAPAAAACGRRARAGRGGRRRRRARGRRARRSARRPARPPARARARATRPARSSGRRRPRSPSGRPPRAGSAPPRRPRSIASITSSPRRRTTSGVMPRICERSRRPVGLALGQLDHGRVAQDRADRPVLLGGGALAPGRQLACATARSRGSSPVTRGSRRQTSSGSRSSVASAIATHSSRAHSSRPRSISRRLDVVGQRHQVLDVAARVAQLLVGQRARVPAREARRLRAAGSAARRAAARCSPPAPRSRRSRRRPACRRRW